MTTVMFNPTQVIISDCIERLETGYHNTYYNSEELDYAKVLGNVTKMALGMIANSDALYHNVEHTILVTLVGQEILLGKQSKDNNVASKDWLHFIISLLCHDIGYVKGVCRQDQSKEGWYAKGIDDLVLCLSPGATDASLTPFHVDRGKLFIDEYFGNHHYLDAEVIKHNIELTRFPVPKDEAHQDTGNYPGLARAADLIGQLSDPRYLYKLPALFYEFQETEATKAFGYNHPGDVRKNYSNFFWNVVYQYIQPALGYLEITSCGKQIIANLYANVFRVESENSLLQN